MKIAIFGGTYDPIHDGHLAIAREAASRFDLDRILFVPAAHPPHKLGQQSASFEHRLNMVTIACEGDERFVASGIEAGTARSYSILTIEKVREQIAGDDLLFFLIGADAFAEVRSWHRWQEIGDRVTFIVVSRPGFEYDVPENFKVLRLDSVALQVASSEIRRELAAGNWAVPVPPGVLAYIAANRLYGASSASNSIVTPQ